MKKLKEIDSDKSLTRMPAVCVVCGGAKNLEISEHTFSYKTPIALLGGLFAGFISFGYVSLNLSYNLEHKMLLRFCNKCLRKSNLSERNGIIAAILFFVIGMTLIFTGIILDDWFHKSPSVYSLISIPYLGWILGSILANALFVCFISMFLFFLFGAMAYWAVGYLAQPKAMISRNQVILKIPKNEIVKVKFDKPKLKLDIG